MENNLILQGKSAVVTGAGSAGVGRATAFALAEEGAKVVVNDFGKDAEGRYLADEVAADIKEAGGTAVVIMTV